MRSHILALLALIPPLLSSASSADQMAFPNPQDFAVPGDPTLADLLTIEPSASIFFSYAREVEVGDMFNDNHALITVLVPTNKAVMALARKPNQGPETIMEGAVLTDEDFYSQSKANVQRWISAHIIPTSPIEFDSKTYNTLLCGKSVRFAMVDNDNDAPEWTRVLIEDGMHIIGSKSASNGVYYLIDGTVKVD